MEPNKNEYSKLRSLLLDSELSRIKNLEEDFSNKEHIKDALREVLKTAKDKPNSEETISLYELIPMGFREHVKTNPEKTIDTLYPILGPLVNKYVSEAMGDTLDSINSKIENQIPLEKIILKAKSKILRVSEEELLLSKMNNVSPKAFMVIEKESGLVKYQKVCDEALKMNPDLFAGLVTALQDFSKDCIGNQDTKLDQIEYGDLQIVLEEAGSSFFAFVTSGKIRLDFKRRLRKILSNIIYQHPNFIEDFNNPSSRIHEKFDDFFTTLKNNSEKTKKASLFKTILMYSLLVLCLFIPLRYSWDSYYTKYFSKTYHEVFFYKSSPLKFKKKINGDVIITGDLPYNKHLSLLKEHFSKSHKDISFVFKTNIVNNYPLNSIEHRLKTISLLLENKNVFSSFTTSLDGVTLITPQLQAHQKEYLNKLLSHYQIKKYVTLVQL